MDRWTIVYRFFFLIWIDTIIMFCFSGNSLVFLPYQKNNARNYYLLFSPTVLSWWLLGSSGSRRCDHTAFSRGVRHGNCNRTIIYRVKWRIAYITNIFHGAKNNYSKEEEEQKFNNDQRNLPLDVLGWEAKITTVVIRYSLSWPSSISGCCEDLMRDWLAILSRLLCLFVMWNRRVFLKAFYTCDTGQIDC